MAVLCHTGTKQHITLHTQPRRNNTTPRRTQQYNTMTTQYFTKLNCTTTWRCKTVPTHGCTLLYRHVAKRCLTRPYHNITRHNNTLPKHRGTLLDQDSAQPSPPLPIRPCITLLYYTIDAISISVIEVTGNAPVTSTL
jgi:hypothetical protein